MARTGVKPRILIVDDAPRIGRMLKRQIERYFGFKVCLPESQEALQDAVLYEAFDSVLVDANLDNWKSPLRIFGKVVRDGIDFAAAYCRVQEKCLTVLFGPAHLPYQELVTRRIKNLSKCNIRIIDRPLPSGEQKIQKALEAIKPEIEQTELIHSENPIFQPVGLYNGLPAQEKNLREHLLYRQASRQTGKWANYNLHKNGDSSWAVMCGGNFQKAYYGELLRGRAAPAPDLRIRRRYPRRSQFAELAIREKTNAFVFWNTHDTSILGEQFVDQRLDKIPPGLEPNFSIAVAPFCAKAYNEQDEKYVIRWCQKLSRFGQLSQLEAVREIFRSLNGDRERSIRELTRRCQRAKLDYVVEIYEGRVEAIVDEQNTAIVEFTSLAGDENFASRFDLAKLRSHGIKEPSQRFEYTVYNSAVGHAFGVIELSE